MREQRKHTSHSMVVVVLGWGMHARGRAGASQVPGAKTTVTGRWPCNVNVNANNLHVFTTSDVGMHVPHTARECDRGRCGPTVFFYPARGVPPWLVVPINLVE